MRENSVNYTKEVIPKQNKIKIVDNSIRQK